VVATALIGQLGQKCLEKEAKKRAKEAEKEAKKDAKKAEKEQMAAAKKAERGGADGSVRRLLACCRARWRCIVLSGGSFCSAQPPGLIAPINTHIFWCFSSPLMGVPRCICNAASSLARAGALSSVSY
jgi:hypothetical protein